MTRIGILHPGEMGVSIAASAIDSGHAVYWASEHRGAHTRQRANEHKLIDAGSISALCSTCEIILCVCPPHAAEDVARLVVEGGFQGFYLDANAISPQRTKRMGQWMSEKNIQFIDGGIIGGPAWKPGETCLFLSGKDAGMIADCFNNGPLETKILGAEIGKASALKMCYAAYSKGTTALLASILATAEALGVRGELYRQWENDEAGFSEQINRRVMRATAKAWRFEGEMTEIASTFREGGLPSGFHEAAAQVYHRMASGKHNQETDSVGEIISHITMPDVPG